MRIGLHTGAVAVGHIGFAERVDYTIIGRTVNIAQKLEQCGRHATIDGEVVILASETTRRSAGAGFRFASCHEVEVDGSGVSFRLLPGEPDEPRA